MGLVYSDKGDIRKTIEHYEQALAIAREIGDKTNEGLWLSNLAGQYSNLSEREKSVDYYEQALANAREIGNKYGESKRLNGLAGVFIEKNEFGKAINHSKEAFSIGEEMSSPEVCIECSYTLAQALLFSEKLSDAQQVAFTAKEYNRPTHNSQISTLHGIILLRQNEHQKAKAAFQKAIAQADEILAKTPGYYRALDAKGLALAGLVLTGNLTGLNEDTLNPDDIHENQHGLKEAQGDLSGFIAESIKTFKRAREIAPHAGVIKANLRLFDELAKCDDEGLLVNIREAVEGK